MWNDDVYGSGINIAVVSNGMDLSHEDLSANVRSGLNWSYSEKNSSEESSSESVDLSDGSSFTGTRAAGVIAATGYNGLGTRGVAPGASIYSYRLSGDLSEADAVVRNKEITAVSVNGRGSEDGAFFQEASSSWEEGLELGISKGFYGKGVFYVRGAGDGHESGDQANFNEYSSYYGVTAVCSTDGFGKKSIFSEEGVNLWVCAPGSDIVTTDNGGGYTVTSGTFLSASQVAGVAALLREINGQLSWRDIKLILAGSARQNDFFDMSWETGAVKYGSDVERYKYSPRYGFGVVDAEAAAELARNWKGVGEMRTVTASSDNELTIPDGEENGDGEADGVLTSGLVIPDLEEIFTEFVEVELVFSHDRLQDLNIQITSPSGTVSELVREFSGEEEGAEISYLRRTHRFGSAKHLGEDPSGEWTLKISDTASGDGEAENSENTGTLHSWSIRVYGHVFLSDRGKEITTKITTLPLISDKVYEQGRLVSEVMPEATGGTAPYNYRFAFTHPLPNGLEFDRDTRVLSGVPTTVGVTNVVYVATDSSPQGFFRTRQFHITITAYTGPSFGSETVEDQVWSNGRAVTLTLPAATGGDGTLNYSLTNSIGDPIKINGLDYNENTRTLSGTLDVSPSGLPVTQTYTYKVTDDDGDSDSITFSITITDLAFDGGSFTDFYTLIANALSSIPTLTSNSLPAATGGTPPYIYSVTPVLPAGLAYNSNDRAIRGTPTTATPRTTYTYTVTDNNGHTAELMFDIAVRALFTSAVINDKVYLTGTEVTEVLPAADGHNGTLTYSLTPNLPSGLDFTPATREISGTPDTATSRSTYTYTVTDTDGFKNSKTFNITVRAEPDTEPSFGSETIDNKVYINGEAVMEKTLPVATSGNAPLTYSLTPALPAGLDFTPATQVISGTPTTATSETDYTYTVTDADNDTDELEFSITVEEDSEPDFSVTTIEDQVYMGRSIRLPVATGGNAPLVYSITPPLPPGLRLDRNTGIISGTPASASSERTYTYTVTDRNGDMKELTFRFSAEVPSTPGPGPTRTSGSDPGGGGGGCAVSDQSSVAYDIPGVMACLILIPVSVLIRRKERARIRTWQ